MKPGVGPDQVSGGAGIAVFAEGAPEKIAHAHLDLNDAKAELGALEFFFDRLVPGGTIVFDDHGWLACRRQKVVEDPWLGARGYSVLELPTGQGLLIKKRRSRRRGSGISRYPG